MQPSVCYERHEGVRLRRTGERQRVYPAPGGRNVRALRRSQVEREERVELPVYLDVLAFRPGLLLLWKPAAKLPMIQRTEQAIKMLRRYRDAEEIVAALAKAGSNNVAAAFAGNTPLKSMNTAIA